jgi:hypothetical protein
MWIDYQIPKLGRVKAELYPIAEMAYRILDKSGHIERMKQTPQLGVIRNVCEGAHHTRWEYVVTQLSIVGHLKIVSQISGLSNNSPIIKGGEEISGAEILQVWTMLLNVGHLFGTFSSERALLSQIKDDKNLRRIFKSGLPDDEEIKAYFDNIVIREDTFRIHELIAFFFLYRLRRSNKREVELLMNILKSFRNDPPIGKERINKLRNLFRRIRQVSFLFLDSHYGPVPVSFELGPILYNFEEYTKELFLSGESPLTRMLESFQNLLSENLYLAPQSIHALGDNSREIEKLIKKENQISRSIPKLDKFLRDRNNFENEHKKKCPEHLLRLLIDERKNPFAVTSTIKPLELEEEWNKRLPSRSCKCTIVNNPNNTVLGITLAFNRDIEHTVKAKLFMKLTQRFIALQDQFYQTINQRWLPRFKPFFKRSFNVPCKELFLFILKNICRNDIYFSINDKPSNSDIWLMERGSTNSARTLNNLCRQYEERMQDSDRVHEIRTLAKALEDINHRGTVLMTTGQIIVRRLEDNSDITDIDGVAICTDSSEFSLILVEAKNTRRSRVSLAKNKLEGTIEDLGLTENQSLDIKGLDGFGAYCRILL